jgi:hypothetical protein
MIAVGIRWDSSDSSVQRGAPAGCSLCLLRQPTAGSPWFATAGIGAGLSFDTAETMAGWGGNDKVEGFYPIARIDADGNPLSGECSYQLRFTTLPPARAFWSVTMCDTSYDRVSGYVVRIRSGDTSSTRRRPVSSMAKTDRSRSTSNATNPRHSTAPGNHRQSFESDLPGQDPLGKQTLAEGDASDGHTGASSDPRWRGQSALPAMAEEHGLPDGRQDRGVLLG